MRARGLCWDDESQGFVNYLVNYLSESQIHLELTDDRNVFIRKLASENWDFFVLDLIDQRGLSIESGAGVSPDKAGLNLAVNIQSTTKIENRDKPVFVVTSSPDTGIIAELPAGVIFKSKTALPSLIALDIERELESRGLLLDRKRVFLIYGHDRSADGATGEVEKFLGDKGIFVDKVTSSTIDSEIATGLLEKIRSAAAIVCVCTPDDMIDGSEMSTQTYWQPRPNVFIEIGMAIGNFKKLSNLVLLQKYGAQDDEKAELPTDLSGYIAIRWSNKISSIFKELQEKLERAGVDFS